MKKLLIIVLLIVGCNNSTEPEDACGVAGGDGTTCADCAGVPNGLSYLDECGGCDANVNNDCIQDCADVWGGTAVSDDCGVCDGIADYVAGSCYDCADVANGVASEDDCGVCTGGTTGVVANHLKDCAGVCNGDTTEEECDACELLSGVWDCAGICGGNNIANFNCLTGTMLDCGTQDDCP